MTASHDSLAANLAQDYAKVVNVAVRHALTKWRSYLAGTGSRAAFNAADIRQIALEALMVFAGLMPERKYSLTGKLEEFVANGGERYVQHNVNMYVSSALAGLVEKSRAAKRGGAVVFLVSLEEREEEETEEGPYAPAGLETSPEALAGTQERFPLLYMTEVQGYSRDEAMSLSGLTEFGYRRARAQEIQEFKAWAVLNRRVAA